LTAEPGGCIVNVDGERSGFPRKTPLLQKFAKRGVVIPQWGSLLEKGGYIEPVDKMGGYRLPSLTGR